MPFIDQITNGLADEMARDRLARKAVFSQQGPFLFDVIGLSEGTIDLKMITPAGEFNTVISHFPDEREQFGEWKISPLAGEKGDGSWHFALGLNC